MFSIKINIIYFISFIIIVRVEALDPLPVVEDNNIAITEAVIRNTVNSLFAPFNIKGIKRKPQIQQYSKIHNYFVSITLKDCENLKKIARLSTVNNIDNNTQNYITQINEVLNEGDKRDQVTTYIERFINKLRYLKEKYVSENNTDINKKILKILEDNEKSYTNVTANNTVSNGTEDYWQDQNILDDNEFRQLSGRRIFEGIRTKIKYFPFMASVHFFDTFQCAGSIIKNDLVITSASCLQIAWNNRFFRENPSFLAVRVGTNMYQFGGEYIPVVEIFFHPQYNPETLAHNLAIMRLGRILRFRKSRKNLKKINIDKNPFPLTSSTSQITVIGWGARDTSNVVYDTYNNRLAYADLAFYPLSECREHYSKVYVTDRNFCAGFFSKGSGACNHDAGGPGISDSKLVGVISFGSPVCGASDAPTVFTKLGYYVDWIESIFEQDALQVREETTMWTPRPHRLPWVATTKRSTRLLIKPMNFPTVKLEDVLRPGISNDTLKDFISTIFSGENDKNVDYIEDSKDKNVRTKEKAFTTEKALTSQNTTIEWFIRTTTPIAAAREAIEPIEDRRDVPNLNIADNSLTTLPITILPMDDQEQATIDSMSNEDFTDAATTTTQNTITTNTIDEEKKSIHDHIMVLIDNLDIGNNFNNDTSEHNDSSEKEEFTTTEGELHTIASENKIDSNPSDSSEKSEITTTESELNTIVSENKVDSHPSDSSEKNEITTTESELNAITSENKVDSHPSDSSDKSEITTPEGELNTIASENKVDSNPSDSSEKSEITTTEGELNAIASEHKVDSNPSDSSEKSEITTPEGELNTIASENNVDSNPSDSSEKSEITTTEGELNAIASEHKVDSNPSDSSEKSEITTPEGELNTIASENNVDSNPSDSSEKNEITTTEGELNAIASEHKVDSNPSDSSDKSEMTAAEGEVNTNASNNKIESNPSESAASNDGTDYNKNYDDDYNEDSDEELGMVIQSGSFQDLTFREMDNRTNAGNGGGEITLF